jgi:hypothetical protein
MTTFAVTSTNQVLDSVNYLLSNLSTGNVSGNITVPAGTLVANVATGQITATGNVSTGANGFSYLNQWVNLRYANNATGSSGFSTVPTNSLYFGVYNSNIATPSSNPTEYVWREVAGGFGTTKTIYYSSFGGRQVQFAAAASPPSSSFVISVANVAIDLDVVTTAAGTPGERGPVVMAYVITTADPTTASSSTLTGWFSASRTSLTPPVGTGLSPVVGDTALFTYPTTGVSAAYEYNGSVWVSATSQVVSGAAIVGNSLNGNAVIGNTLSGAAVVDESLAGDKLLFNTISGNKIIFNTITGNLIAANTITGNTIQVGTLTGNLIAANTITGNTIQVGTLTGNLIAANTITSTNIAANTIVANNIAAGTITTDKLAANVLTANTVVSTGATIGSFTSAGFWLQGTTGNARFGNTVSIGNSLTIGNNASIGGNLTVAGLITAGNLQSNTVATTTIVPAAVSTGVGITSTANAIVSNNNSAGDWSTLTGTANVVITQASQPIYVYGGGELNASFTGTANNPIWFNIRLRKFDPNTGLTTTLTSLRSPFYTPPASGTNYFQSILNIPGYLDTGPTSFISGMSMQYFFELNWQGTGATFMVIRSSTNSILAQTLKR